MGEYAHTHVCVCCFVLFCFGEGRSRWCPSARQSANFAVGWAAAAAAKVLDVGENAEHVLPVVRSAVDDRSWRVRFNVAKEYHSLSRSLGPEATSADLLPSFVNLLQVALRGGACQCVRGSV